MNLKRIVAPSTTPVTLTEAKAHLRVTSSAEDTLITALIEAATDHLDAWTGYLGRALITQTWDLFLDEFPAEAIEIPLPPLQSVTGVYYIDANDAEQTVDPANYIVDDKSLNGWIVPVTGAEWPEAKEGWNNVRVRFVAGYGVAATVPAAIRAAILLIIGDLYRNREAASDVEILRAPTVDRLLGPYRVVSP